ncbi:alpha/beta hydrolase [Archangium lipolyticum]|uniref:alpha/beta hydrolase n=1 Tax=Archangium lipolyticum TaxID=2970465 RepID=UPI00214A85B6|nr:alpha/beta hydrolase [Archangium lipolyticum]
MARLDEGFFTGKDGLRLFWMSEQPEQPRAHVAVVHGYGDHIGRYRTTFDALTAQGYAVHGFDYRGHGRADGRRGFCASWPDYLDDLAAFWERVRRAAEGRKMFVLAHSHGALMTVHLLGRGGLQGVSGVVLSAPYFKLAITPPALKLVAARAVGRVLPWMPIKTELSMEDLSRDEAVQEAARQDPLYNQIVTPRWFIEATEAQARVMSIAPEVKVPLFQLCGAEDRVASVEAGRLFFDAVGSKDKVYKVYPGMRHEPLNELGKEEVQGDISNWISSHL